MPSKTYKLNFREFDNGPYPFLQHKLRLVSNCYTVFELKINEGEQTFSFKKRLKRKGIKFDDSELYSGNYKVNLIEDSIFANVTISVKEKRWSSQKGKNI